MPTYNLKINQFKILTVPIYENVNVNLKPFRRKNVTIHNHIMHWKLLFKYALLLLIKWLMQDNLPTNLISCTDLQKHFNSLEWYTKAFINKKSLIASRWSPSTTPLVWTLSRRRTWVKPKVLFIARFLPRSSYYMTKTVLYLEPCRKDYSIRKYIQNRCRQAQNKH